MMVQAVFRWPLQLEKSRFAFRLRLQPASGLSTPSEVVLDQDSADRHYVGA